MKDLWVLAEYFFFFGIPGLSAKELFGSGHPILAVLLMVYSFVILLYRHDHINK